MSDILYNVIIPQLDKCREVASGKDKGWSACCPAHDDKSPSFSLALCHDGKILMHCYGGCSINEICFSLGVKPQDLFPEDSNWKAKRRDPSVDEWAIEMAESMIARGKRLNDQDKKRYRGALDRKNNNRPSPTVDRGQVARGALKVSEREAERTRILCEIAGHLSDNTQNKRDKVTHLRPSLHHRNQRSDGHDNQS